MEMKKRSGFSDMQGLLRVEKDKESSENIINMKDVSQIKQYRNDMMNSMTPSEVDVDINGKKENLDVFNTQLKEMDVNNNVKSEANVRKLDKSDVDVESEDEQEEREVDRKREGKKEYTVEYKENRRQVKDRCINEEASGEEKEEKEEEKFIYMSTGIVDGTKIRHEHSGNTDSMSNAKPSEDLFRVGTFLVHSDSVDNKLDDEHIRNTSLTDFESTNLGMEDASSMHATTRTNKEDVTRFVPKILYNNEQETSENGQHKENDRVDNLNNSFLRDVQIADTVNVVMHNTFDKEYNSNDMSENGKWNFHDISGTNTNSTTYIKSDLHLNEMECPYNQMNASKFDDKNEYAHGYNQTFNKDVQLNEQTVNEKTTASQVYNCYKNIKTENEMVKSEKKIQNIYAKNLEEMSRAYSSLNANRNEDDREKESSLSVASYNNEHIDTTEEPLNEYDDCFRKRIMKKRKKRSDEMLTDYTSENSYIHAEEPSKKQMKQTVLSDAEQNISRHRKENTEYTTQEENSENNASYGNLEDDGSTLCTPFGNGGMNPSYYKNKQLNAQMRSSYTDVSLNGQMNELTNNHMKDQMNGHMNGHINEHFYGRKLGDHLNSRNASSGETRDNQYSYIYNVEKEEGVPSYEANINQIQNKIENKMRGCRGKGKGRGYAFPNTLENATIENYSLLGNRSVENSRDSSNDGHTGSMEHEMNRQTSIDAKMSNAESISGNNSSAGFSDEKCFKRPQRNAAKKCISSWTEELKRKNTAEVKKEEKPEQPGEQSVNSIGFENRMSENSNAVKITKGRAGKEKKRKEKKSDAHDAVSRIYNAAASSSGTLINNNGNVTNSSVNNMDTNGCSDNSNTEGSSLMQDLQKTYGQMLSNGLVNGEALFPPIVFDETTDEREMFRYLEFLRHLPNKIGGAQYKIQKALLTEEMVKRAKKFPLVQGVYFDRYQQRWSVNWNEDGKRVAKYFPIKLFGFDYARKLAIHCKNYQKIPEEALIYERAYRANQQNNKFKSDVFPFNILPNTGKKQTRKGAKRKNAGSGKGAKGNVRRNNNGEKKENPGENDTQNANRANSVRAASGVNDLGSLGFRPGAIASSDVSAYLNACRNSSDANIQRIQTVKSASMETAEAQMAQVKNENILLGNMENETVCKKRSNTKDRKKKAETGNANFSNNHDITNSSTNTYSHSGNSISTSNNSSNSTYDNNISSMDLLRANASGNANAASNDEINKTVLKKIANALFPHSEGSVNDPEVLHVIKGLVVQLEKITEQEQVKTGLKNENKTFQGNEASEMKVEYDKNRFDGNRFSKDEKFRETGFADKETLPRASYDTVQTRDSLNEEAERRTGHHVETDASMLKERHSDYGNNTVAENTNYFMLDQLNELQKKIHKNRNGSNNSAGLEMNHSLMRGVFEEFHSTELFTNEKTGKNWKTHRAGTVSSSAGTSFQSTPTYVSPVSAPIFSSMSTSSSLRQDKTRKNGIDQLHRNLSNVGDNSMSNSTTLGNSSCEVAMLTLSNSTLGDGQEDKNIHGKGESLGKKVQKDKVKNVDNEKEIVDDEEDEEEEEEENDEDEEDEEDIVYDEDEEEEEDEDEVEEEEEEEEEGEEEEDVVEEGEDENSVKNRRERLKGTTVATKTTEEGKTAIQMRIPFLKGINLGEEFQFDETHFPILFGKTTEFLEPKKTDANNTNRASKVKRESTRSATGLGANPGRGTNTNMVVNNNNNNNNNRRGSNNSNTSRINDSTMCTGKEMVQQQNHLMNSVERVRSARNVSGNVNKKMEMNMNENGSVSDNVDENGNRLNAGTGAGADTDDKSWKHSIPDTVDDNDINSRIVGVHYDRKQYRWKATWYTSHGRRCAKYYPVKQYGFEKAKTLAIECRTAYNFYKKLKKNPKYRETGNDMNFGNTTYSKDYYITLFENDETKYGCEWDKNKSKKVKKNENIENVLNKNVTSSNGEETNINSSDSTPMLNINGDSHNCCSRESGSDCMQGANERFSRFNEINDPGVGNTAKQNDEIFFTNRKNENKMSAENNITDRSFRCENNSIFQGMNKANYNNSVGISEYDNITKNATINNAITLNPRILSVYECLSKCEIYNACINNTKEEKDKGNYNYNDNERDHDRSKDKGNENKCKTSCEILNQFDFIHGNEVPYNNFNIQKFNIYNNGVFDVGKMNQKQNICIGHNNDVNMHNSVDNNHIDNKQNAKLKNKFECKENGLMNNGTQNLSTASRNDNNHNQYDEGCSGNRNNNENELPCFNSTMHQKDSFNGNGKNDSDVTENNAHKCTVNSTSIINNIINMSSEGCNGMFMNNKNVNRNSENRTTTANGEGCDMDYCCCFSAGCKHSCYLKLSIDICKYVCYAKNSSCLLALYCLSHYMHTFQKVTMKRILQDLRDECLSNVAYVLPNDKFREYYMSIHFLSNYVDSSNGFDDLFMLLKLFVREINLRMMPSLLIEQEQLHLLELLSDLTKRIQNAMGIRELTANCENMSGGQEGDFSISPVQQ